ncbi:hypothetical protein IWZ03DRAFT_386233 [Phyllosticta citriasiana]|uniref:Glucose-methanol-choline oxidoreductase N-terminal domain-containing protein n=1 Tax=Phyllosticta citriasiana TaxID=595635 RepID=A0ABR1KAS7_9PEZI
MHAAPILASLLTLLPLIESRHNPILPRSADLDTDYEYVVVGSGPGGGPLAANLAAAGHKVLLIDAGGDQGDHLYEEVPVLFPFATEFPETEWDFFVTRNSDPSIQAQDTITSYRLSNGSIYTGLNPPADSTALGTLYPRAGTLGGCSRHNALVTIRAFDSDWEAVAERTGDSSWSGSTFQRLFENMEKCEYLPNSIVGHGFDGWLYTSLTSLLTAVSDLKVVSVILSAGSAMGINIAETLIGTVTGLGEVLLKDVNAPGSTISSGPYQIPLAMNSANSTRGGARDRIMQVANAVHDDGSRKYQLDIKLETFVTKIRFDNTTADGTPIATGVDYLEGQSLYRADPRWQSATVRGSGSINATKEVIIAAGAFNTPQLLKLSGVGPKEELESFDIPVLVDLPGVGANLRDHIEVPVISNASKDFSLIDGCTFMQGYPDTPDPCLKKWLDGTDQTSKGVYATNGLAVGAALKSSAATQDDPDLFVYGGPANFPGFFPGWAERAFGDHHHWVWVSLKASTLNTAGTVTLNSSDPRDLPNIAFNTFQDAQSQKQDLQASYEGISFARRAMDDLIPLDGSFFETQPGRDNAKTEEEIKNYAYTNSFGHHACCTAAIGGDDDEGAVLDSEFRVRGVSGLRVVDASAFPIVPGFFIALPTYLLAEKASEAILNATLTA